MEVEELTEGGGGIAGGDLERRVMAAVKASEARGDPPLVRAVEVGRCVQEKGLGLPNPELGLVLVSNLCFAHNSPSLWKLLDQAMASYLLCPLHTLALLTSRVIPHRRAQPEAYRLYLELLSRYALSPPWATAGPLRDKITKSIDDALRLSQTYGVQQVDFGHAVVLFIMSVITSLIDCALEDCGLQLVSAGKRENFYASEGHQTKDVELKGSSNDKRNEHCEQLRRTNALMAIEVLEKITANKRTKVFLRLTYLNMPEKFNSLLQRLKFIEVHKSQSERLVSSNHILNKMFRNIQTAMNGNYQLKKHHLLGGLLDAGPSSSLPCHRSGPCRAACWLPLDIFMEDAMDGKHLYSISAMEILTELVKTLQELNQASWQETFQALWISALRLVQRDREPLEAPIPQLDARLSMLLSIVPLAILPIMKEENKISPLVNSGIKSFEHGTEENKFASRRHGLISSLQVLGQFSGLLSPPASVVSAANNAATKAATFISNFKSGNGNVNVIGRNDASVKAVGNLLHLIVESCIARNLIDTSAYFWPGYVVPSTSSKDSMIAQEFPWSTFMEGAQLTGSLKNALMVTPATSIAELEKLYHIALNGSEEEKPAAARILCGASLVRGWNIQEQVVRVVVKLLSPPIPPDYAGLGPGGHLISHMTMLNALLFGVPEVAAALMPLCEAFGSIPLPSHHRPCTSDETSVYTVFSCAFIVLLRLWKFYRPPQEQCTAGRIGPVRMELTLDYLLLMRNSRIALQNSMAMDRTDNVTDPFHASPCQPVYIDSFPKLRAWYFQNQACIASTLSGLCSKSPVYQVANRILNMICRKMAKPGSVSSNPSSTSSSSISGPPMNSTDDTSLRPTLSAWEVLEAVPFVLEAVLTACAHGRLSSRDLTTGLKDLVDFLPASLATIISYFSAEITRGIWKPVPMNGTDWPSPAANLLSVESEIREILASAGVHIPCSPRVMPPVLPLPMAALVSLTITFKLDRSLEYIHSVVGPALENCASGCSWPSMPVVGALWSQKVRRWRDLVVFSCTRSPFIQNKDAVAQLVRSCFSSFLGPSVTGGSHLTTQRGVNGLLGQAIVDLGLRLPISPGFLYLRTCRSFHDTHVVNEVILKLVIEWVHKLANEWACGGPAHLGSGRTSLAAAASGVQQVAALGASLLCVAGGIQLVQVLYEETLPTFLLSTREEKLNCNGPVCNILEGYAMAYMLILSGAFVWGLGNSSLEYREVYSSRRARVLGIHLDFMAGVLEGNITLGCDLATWKAYASCFVGLLVSFMPEWVPEVKQEVLRKLARGLRGWHECDLALSLLERGGPAAMAAVVESVL